MIKIKEVVTYGWEAAIRGMRNPMNSWDKSDSYTCPERGCNHSCSVCEDRHTDRCADGFLAGKNDLKLMTTLSNAGADHGKFLRMINVSMDITAPLYWWKEFDTYKVGTVANSCSTMHKIHAKEFELDDFSHDHLNGETLDLWTNSDNTKYSCSSIDFCHITCDVLNYYRNLYLKTNDKKYWWQMIQLLPSSYNQRRTVQLNYAVLKNMYHARKNHKLDEWKMFCEMIESLPYFSKLIGGK